MNYIIQDLYLSYLKNAMCYYLIDDVRNSTPKLNGEISDYGKAKYSIPYFIENGYETVMDEYQVILQKKQHKNT